MASSEGPPPRGGAKKRMDKLLSKLYSRGKPNKDAHQAGPERGAKKVAPQNETALQRLGLKGLLKAKRAAGATGMHPDDMDANHHRLLYLISQYAGVDSAKWLREQSLVVLLYEGIVAGVLDYDYAPKSQTVQDTLLFLNISQEGLDDLGDLREALMLNVLLVSTYQHHVTSTYQLTEDGAQALGKWRQSQPAAYAAGTAAINSLIFKNKEGRTPKDIDTYAYLDHAPQTLLMVDWDLDLDRYVLSNQVGYWRLSNITDIEDLTYVSSPYIPACIQNGLHVQDMPRSNHQIAAKVVDALRRERLQSDSHQTSHHNIRDELDEVVHLNDVRVMVGEWIPFGRNHMANLIKKLGAERKVQGGMFTTAVDEAPGSTLFQYDWQKVGNCLRVLDYQPAGHVNFLADITTPEEEGIVQVEEFGCHVHFDGSVIYGLEINSVMEALGERMSMDKLCRLLVDIQQDSSFLTYSITTAYQRVLMDTMSGGCSVNREKYNCLIAESIEPRRPAAEYFDGEELQMEIQQVIGDVRGCYDIGEQGEVLLMLGSSGMLLVGADVYAHEQLLVAYLCLRSREMGMERFVNRLFQLGDTLQELRHCVITYTEDPGSLDKMALLQSETLHEIINLQELLSQIIEGLDLNHSILSSLRLPELHPAAVPGPVLTTAAGLPPIRTVPLPNLPARAPGLRGKTSLKRTTRPATTASVTGVPSRNGKTGASGQATSHAQMVEALDIQELYASLKLRCTDMAIHLQGARAELDSLRHMTSYISTQESFKLNSQVQANTRNLEDVFRANERSSSSLEIMQVILAGSLAFDILDRCATMYLSIGDRDSPYERWLISMIREPFVWFVVNFAFWLLMSFLLIRFMRYLASRAHGVLTVRLTLNIPISVTGLARMLASKEVQSEDLMVDEGGFLRNCSYADNSPVWRGHKVKVDIIYDEKSSHLLKSYLQVPKSCGFNNVEEVQDAFFEDLIRFRALLPEVVAVWKRSALTSQKEEQRKMTRMLSLIRGGGAAKPPPGSGSSGRKRPKTGTNLMRSAGQLKLESKTRFDLQHETEMSANSFASVEKSALNMQRKKGVTFGGPSKMNLLSKRGRLVPLSQQELAGKDVEAAAEEGSGHGGKQPFLGGGSPSNSVHPG